MHLYKLMTRTAKCFKWFVFLGLVTVSMFHRKIWLFAFNYTPYHAVGYSYPEDELPMAPPDEPAPIVLLHTYMRGGSSLLGSIFDRNPNVLYHFEPLYSLYQAAMNTEHYHLMPLHVHAFPNGTLRKTTEFEDKIVLDRLFDLLDCRMDRLRMEQITTAFISRSQALQPFERCMGSFTIGQRNYCTILTVKQCGGFISDAMDNKCHVFMANVLQDSQALEALSSQELEDFTDKFSRSFITADQYKKCLGDVYHYYNICKSVYQQRCENSRLKVAKLVRNNMDFLRKSLKERNDVFVIYQTRDPRGMMNSRKSLNFLTFDFKTEAEIECKKLYTDYHDILRLKNDYPDKVFILKYEDLAERTILLTKQIYNFIGIEPPQMIFDSLKNSMSSIQLFDIRFSTARSNGKEAAWIWKKKMSKSDREIVETACKEFFRLNIYDL